MGRARGASVVVAATLAVVVAAAFYFLPRASDQGIVDDNRAGTASEPEPEGGPTNGGEADGSAEAANSDDPNGDDPDGRDDVEAAPVLTVDGEDKPAMTPLDQCLMTRAERLAIIEAVIADGTPEWVAVRSPEFEAQYRQAVVSTMYCQVLGRPAEEEGLQFWAGELGSGMPVYDLYLLLTESEEYQLTGALTGIEVLESLQLSDDLQALAARATATDEATADDAIDAEEADQDLAAPLLEPADQTTTSAATTTTGPPPSITTTTAAVPAPVDPEAEARELAIELDNAAGVGGFRARTPITTETFDTWVTLHGLQDLDYVTDALVHGTRHVGNQKVNVAFVHLSQTRGVSVSPGDNGRATVGRWAQEIGAHVAVNGNWYSPWDGPAVSGGVVYAGTDHNYTSLFGFTADGDAIIEHHREINDQVDPRIVEGVSGHPTLIHRGVPTTDFGTDPTFLNRNPRTAIGLDQSGDVLILVTVDGRRSSAIGMTGAETVQLMTDVGAVDAVMLDGGGSSTMWIAGRGVVNRPSGGLRSVGNQIAVFGD